MKCPGQDTQYWNNEAIFETECPECGHIIEFFKDDATRKCPNCKKKIVNPRMDFGCASYCKFAEQCLGTLPEEFIAQRNDLLKDRVAVEAKKYLGTDFKLIGHASRTANFAEKIGKLEKADLAAVLCAAYLYNIEGSDKKACLNTAEQIMTQLGAQKQLIKQVLELVSGSGQDTQEDINKMVLHDADTLARMAECDGKDEIDTQALTARIERLFKTEAGKELARQVLTDRA